MQEVWKDIKEYEGLYQISNTGKIKNVKTGKILKSGDNGRGYLFVFLCKDVNHHKRFYVHRLVATHFIDNKDNLPQVNHIDGNKSNNNVNNLEWCTPLHNSLHKREVLGKTNCKTVKCIETGEIFKSIDEAANYYGLSRTTLTGVLKQYKGHKTFAGYHWKYVL